MELIGQGKKFNKELYHSRIGIFGGVHDNKFKIKKIVERFRTYLTESNKEPLLAIINDLEQYPYFKEKYNDKYYYKSDNIYIIFYRTNLDWNVDVHIPGHNIFVEDIDRYIKPYFRRYRERGSATKVLFSGNSRTELHFRGVGSTMDLISKIERTEGNCDMSDYVTFTDMYNTAEQALGLLQDCPALK